MKYKKFVFPALFAMLLLLSCLGFAATSDIVFNARSTGVIDFNTAGTIKGRIANDGNFIIGGSFLAVPKNKFNVIGDVNIVSLANRPNTDRNYIVFQVDSNTVKVPAHALTIDQNGNLSTQIGPFVGNNQLMQMEGGLFYGRMGISQNQLALDQNSIGATWTARASSKTWNDIAMSSDGKYQTGVTSGDTIYTSYDYGQSWTARDSSRTWRGVAMSSDGKYQTAVENSTDIYVSSNYGASWTVIDSTNQVWWGIAMSSDGRIQTATVNNGQIYTSYDYGLSWTARASSLPWLDVAMSSTGKYQTAVANGGNAIRISSDYGVTWTATGLSGSFISIAMSSDGKYQTATPISGNTLYTSSDYGVNWTARASSGAWRGIALSADGRYQTAGISSGQIYTSYDYGRNWTARDSNRGWNQIAMSSDGKYQSAVDESPGFIYTSYANSYSPDGNFGIGAPTPPNKLNVIGDFNVVTSGTNNPSIYINPSDGNIAVAQNFVTAGYRVDVNGNMRVAGDFAITGSSNLGSAGIVTSAVFNAAFPIQDANIPDWITIDTNSFVKTYGDFNAYRGLDVNFVRSFDTNAIFFDTSGLTRLKIGNDGNVGIGLPSTITNPDNDFVLIGDLNITQAGKLHPSIYTNPTDGNVGIGRESITAGNRLDVNGYMGVNGNLVVTGTTNAALATPAGTVVSITSIHDFNSGSKTAAGVQIMKSYALGANSYTKIRVRASGFAIGTANTQTDANFLITGLDANSPMVEVRADATGNGDIFTFPWTVEYAGAKQTASNVQVDMKWLAGTVTWQFTDLEVEGLT